LTKILNHAIFLIPPKKPYPAKERSFSMTAPSASDKKVPKCMAQLDFEIISRSGGKEKAIRTMLIIAGIKKERLARKITN
jgi:hypothetical protein